MQGRFPANVILSHSPDCIYIGVKKIKPDNGSGKAGYSSSRAMLFQGKRGDIKGATYVGEDGKETVPDWECVPYCPVRLLDEQSGERPTGAIKQGTLSGQKKDEVYGDYAGYSNPGYISSNGGASRFFVTLEADTDEWPDVQEGGKMDSKVIFGDGNIKLFQGDCYPILQKARPDVIDAVVIDPPAGIAFMGKEWDKDKGGRDAWIDWLSTILVQVYRVMKPGAYMFCWALPRTSHWTGTAIENAGFEIRDVITHINGQGFPKAHVWTAPTEKDKERNPRLAAEDEKMVAAGYEGWANGGLKPASEHWILARKPFKGTTAENVLEYGTGALNIDEARLKTNEELVRPEIKRGETNSYHAGLGAGTQKEPSGRFPANLILTHSPGCVCKGEKKVKGTAPMGKPCQGKKASVLGTVVIKNEYNVPNEYADEDGKETVADWQCVEGCPVAELDKQSGTGGTGKQTERTSKANRAGTYSGFDMCSGEVKAPNTYADEGGASRFFTQLEYEAPFIYAAKASTGEKNKGCTALPPKRIAGINKWVDVDYRKGSGEVTAKPKQNNHPTVKSVKLITWLANLITPKGGVLLDVFMGSGTTAVVAIQQGYQFIGMELEADSFNIAVARAEYEWSTKHAS
jgi:DNA modification methylase